MNSTLTITWCLCKTYLESNKFHTTKCIRKVTHGVDTIITAWCTRKVTNSAISQAETIARCILWSYTCRTNNPQFVLWKWYQNKTVHFYQITNSQQVKNKTICSIICCFSPHLPIWHNCCMKNTEHFQILTTKFISFVSSFLFLHQGYSIKGLADLNITHQ